MRRHFDIASLVKGMTGMSFTVSAGDIMLDENGDYQDFYRQHLRGRRGQMDRNAWLDGGRFKAD